MALVNHRNYGSISVMTGSALKRTVKYLTNRVVSKIEATAIPSLLIRFFGPCHQYTYSMTGLADHRRRPSGDPATGVSGAEELEVMRS